MAMNTTIKTKILEGHEARLALQKGINKMADAVGSTLSPRGQNVGIAKQVPSGEIYERIILHDGVSVARAIELENEFENFGAQILKQAAQKQVDAVGDGTTVVMILAQAIINECMSLIGSGINPMSLRQGLEEAKKKLIQELETLATPIRGIKDMRYIASISAQDKELGHLIADTLDKVGKDGVITVEESKGPETVMELQEGMQIDKGYAHPWLVTNPERMEAVLENAYFLITDLPITTLAPLAKFFESFVKQSKMLVVISPDISGEALPLFIQNKLEGKLMTLCIQAPSFGEDQKAILQDIAILTGGKYISSDAGYKLEDITPDDLGFAEYITSTKDETIIVGGRGEKEEIKRRAESLRTQLLSLDSEFEEERLRARLGKLTNGVAVIRVGGQTEIEMKERRERVIDAVAATRAAMIKGIVPGGEVVYLHIRKILDKTILTDKILYEALYAPFKKLLTNADLSEVEIALSLQGKTKNYGVDVTDGKTKDMIRAQIVDPVLVGINAIENSISVAIQLITTNTLIVPAKENPNP